MEIESMLAGEPSTGTRIERTPANGSGAAKCDETPPANEPAVRSSSGRLGIICRGYLQRQPNTDRRPKRASSKQDYVTIVRQSGFQDVPRGVSSRVMCNADRPSRTRSG